MNNSIRSRRRCTSRSRTIRIYIGQVDGTGIGGKHFESASGVLCFHPGIDNLEIVVNLLHDDSWGSVVQFHVDLEGADNAVLDPTLRSANVEKIDDDTFPTGTHLPSSHQFSPSSPR